MEACSKRMVLSYNFFLDVSFWRWCSGVGAALKQPRGWFCRVHAPGGPQETCAPEACPAAASPGIRAVLLWGSGAKDRCLQGGRPSRATRGRQPPCLCNWRLQKARWEGGKPMCTCLSFSEAYSGKAAFPILQPVEGKKQSPRKKAASWTACLALVCCAVLKD